METSPTMITTASHRHQQPSSFNIRGLSGSGNGNGLSIRGEAGPSTVLISNLDPGANAEDVKVCIYIYTMNMDQMELIVCLFYLDGMYAIWQSVSH